MLSLIERLTTNVRTRKVIERGQTMSAAPKRWCCNDWERKMSAQKDFWSYVRSGTRKPEMGPSKMMLQMETGYTWRRVSTVRGQVSENLPL